MILRLCHGQWKQVFGLGMVPRAKGGSYCACGYSLRFSIVEERSYLQVPSVRGHVTMTSTAYDTQGRLQERNTCDSDM